jgi:hypothetical protein
MGRPTTRPIVQQGASAAVATELEKRFHRAMIGVYERAKAEAGYDARRFIGMLGDRDGVEVAKYLIRADKPSEGYTALWGRKRLDLTVEAIIQSPEWQPLFSDDDRKRALDRLKEYGYEPPEESNSPRRSP